MSCFKIWKLLNDTHVSQDETFRITLTPPAPMNYEITNLLTPWSRVLLQKLTVNFAASQKIPRIYGTRKMNHVIRTPKYKRL
jgi:hypothetical protein